MQITTKAEYIWSDKQSRHILVRKKSIIWIGPVAFAKGASAAQNNLANQQAGFYSALQGDYAQQFAGQNAILGTLTNTLNPIIAAGPNQFGFNAAETNNLNSQAIQGTGQQYNNAKQALGAQQAAAGGGNTLLPSGVQSQQQAGLASSAANQASNQLLGIQQAGYEQGHQQYESAIGQLGGVASQYNPEGYASQATGAGSAAANTANQITQENNAASPWGLVGGILGGAASGFASGFGGGLGKSFFNGSSSSNGGSGGGDDLDGGQYA
jgi:hypothetical protein